jgi:hypothetical protein
MVGVLKYYRRQLNFTKSRLGPQLPLVAAAEQCDACSRAKDDGLIGIAEETAGAASYRIRLAKDVEGAFVPAKLPFDKLAWDVECDQAPAQNLKWWR